MDTKPGKLLTDSESFPLLKSHDPLKIDISTITRLMVSKLVTVLTYGRRLGLALTSSPTFFILARKDYKLCIST